MKLTNIMLSFKCFRAKFQAIKQNSKHIMNYIYGNKIYNNNSLNSELYA